MQNERRWYKVELYVSMEDDDDGTYDETMVKEAIEGLLHTRKIKASMVKLVSEAKDKEIEMHIKQMFKDIEQLFRHQESYRFRKERMREQKIWWTHKQMEDKPNWFRHLISVCNNPPSEPTEETATLWEEWCVYQRNQSNDEHNQEIKYPTIESEIYKFEQFFVTLDSTDLAYAPEIDDKLKEQIKKLNKEIDGDRIGKN